jgi:hypothetical protein
MDLQRTRFRNAEAPMPPVRTVPALRLETYPEKGYRPLLLSGTYPEKGYRPLLLSGT